MGALFCAARLMTGTQCSIKAEASWAWVSGISPLNVRMTVKVRLFPNVSPECIGPKSSVRKSFTWGRYRYSARLCSAQVVSPSCGRMRLSAVGRGEDNTVSSTHCRPSTCSTGRS
ncbi:hypothetical protein D3C75_924130 [compost metagenome]